MGIAPVIDYPALLIESDERVLVISDLHLGYEYELLKKGINVPNQSSLMKMRIKEIISQTDADKLIFLGDIKHNIPNISNLEAKILPSFLDLGRPYDIVKGNHDGNIESLTGHASKNYVLYDDILLFHGHMNLPCVEFGTLVLGHSHPAIEITDELGKRTKEKCWIRGKLPSGQSIIIMPSFNHLITGLTFNQARSRIPGTLFKRFTPAQLKMEAYLLDGTFLGKLEDIR